MAASKIIDKQNFLTFLDLLFHNLNLNNEGFIKKLYEEFEENKNQTYWFKKFKSVFIDSLKNLNTSKSFLYTQYWTIRGWSIDEAKQHIRKYFKKSNVFFSNEEIFNYMITKNPYNFNIQNTDIIQKFVNTIEIDDHIAEHEIADFFSKWCNNFYTSINKNKGYVIANIEYYLARGYNIEDAKKIISQYQKEKSMRSVEYFKKRGFSEKEAKIKVSEAQSKNASFSKSTSNYWKNIGLSDTDAKEKAAYYAELKSVWSKKYWISKGYSEEEAIEKTHENNGGCPECKCYNGDIGLYINSMNNLKEKQEKIWKSITKNKSNFVNSVIIKSGWLKNTSKGENLCFNYLIQNIDPNIKHETYVVLFPEGFQSKLNNYFYACDGYLQISDKHIIIIEYDGGVGVFHTPEKDLIRDKEILLLDNNVLGILRIRETFFKKTNIIDINEQINYGIQKIKNCEEERVILS